jgi:hypothetical protein
LSSSGCESFVSAAGGASEAAADLGARLDDAALNDGESESIDLDAGDCAAGRGQEERRRRIALFHDRLLIAGEVEPSIGHERLCGRLGPIDARDIDDEGWHRAQR